MPTYEYLCRKCNSTFAVVMSIKEHDGATVKCPDCGGTDVVQQYPVFFAKTGKKS